MKNSWITEEEKVLLSSPVIDVIERKCKSSEDGRKFTFYSLSSRDWCNIIPVTEDGKIVLVKQFRIGVSSHTEEIPGGVVDLEDLGNQEGAIREMEEETGYRLIPGGKCVPLGWAHPNPAMFNNRCHSYIVGPVRKNSVQHLDPGEMIEVLEVPISEIPKMIQSQELSHALMLNAFLFLMLDDPEGQDILRRRLNKFSGLQLLKEN